MILSELLRSLIAPRRRALGFQSPNPSHLRPSFRLRPSPSRPVPPPRAPRQGIVCDAASGRVVGLSLPEMGLSGQLPGEMAQMNDLTSIEVPRNYLQGDIPNTINNLGKLQVADLAGNAISGQIPDLSPMRALRVLLLDGNQLQDAVPYTITALSSLGLSGNTLGGALPSTLSALSRLTWLRVDGNQLVGPLPPGLAAMASAPGAVFNLTANDPTLCGTAVRAVAVLAIALLLFAFLCLRKPKHPSAPSSASATAAVAAVGGTDARSEEEAAEVDYGGEKDSETGLLLLPPLPPPAIPFTASSPLLAPTLPPPIPTSSPVSTAASAAAVSPKYGVPARADSSAATSSSPSAPPSASAPSAALQGTSPRSIPSSSSSHTPSPKPQPLPSSATSFPPIVIPPVVPLPSLRSLAHHRSPLLASQAAATAAAPGGAGMQPLTPPSYYLSGSPKSGSPHTPSSLLPPAALPDSATAAAAAAAGAAAGTAAAAGLRGASMEEGAGEAGTGETGAAAAAGAAGAAGAAVAVASSSRLPTYGGAGRALRAADLEGDSESGAEGGGKKGGGGGVGGGVWSSGEDESSTWSESDGSVIEGRRGKLGRSVSEVSGRTWAAGGVRGGGGEGRETAAEAATAAALVGGGREGKARGGGGGREKVGGAGDTEGDEEASSEESESGGSGRGGAEKVFSLAELALATNDFGRQGQRNLLGAGRHGVVYKARLPDGTTVAVKRLTNCNPDQSEREFRFEAEAVARARHPNIVALLGCCAEGAERLLVSEFVPNGTLHSWLHAPAAPAAGAGAGAAGAAGAGGPSGSDGDGGGGAGESAACAPLDWKLRVHIALGCARGLAYLHEGADVRVVHRDVKASNVLVDAQWNPKLADFALAAISGRLHSHAPSRLLGTVGYVAPEYINTGLLTERSDVYSFGVLLLELVAGRKPIDTHLPPEQVDIVRWVKRLAADGRLAEAVEGRIAGQAGADEVEYVVGVALRCVDGNALKRPRMRQVVAMLETEDPTLVRGGGWRNAVGVCVDGYGEVR
ncbi:unnamed protein product [Closterium sp. Yama58-4]|nr:unnamed protein product [Closterium sp. Yama58-4]